MAGVSGVQWLGLTPHSITKDLVKALLTGMPATTTRVDVADLEAQRVEAVPLLLQLGLLSPLVGQPTVCRPPNQYALQSLQQMANTALVVESADFGRMAAALRRHSCAAFVSAATTLFENIPRRIFKKAGEGGADALRESAYHIGLLSSMLLLRLPGIDVTSETNVHRGTADIIVKFFSGPRTTVWIIDLAFGPSYSVIKKLNQVEQYALAYDVDEVICMALLVKHVEPASATTDEATVDALVEYAWSQRTLEGWALIEAGPEGGVVRKKRRPPPKKAGGGNAATGGPGGAT